MRRQRSCAYRVVRWFIGAHVGLSGNMLLPLLYHSFRPESIYLWTIFCRRTGCGALYKVKQRLHQALLDGDLEQALMMTDQSIEDAMTQQSGFVS